MSETEVVSKVEELMKALDEVKRYKALSSLMVDFVIIILLSVGSLLSIELAANLLRATVGFPCSYLGPAAYSCGESPGTVPPIVIAAGLPIILTPCAGILGGVLWVDRKLKRVRVGEWKETLAEGFPGAVKLITDMSWDRVFEEIQVSKMVYLVYGLVRVVGYFIFVSIVLLYSLQFVGSGLLHAQVNALIVYMVSFVLVVVSNRKDLERRYRQVWSLDALIWELRWSSSEFGSASFKT